MASGYEAVRCAGSGNDGKELPAPAIVVMHNVAIEDRGTSIPTAHRKDVRASWY